jgi:hypothetical protein
MVAEKLRRSLTAEETAARKFLYQNPHLTHHDQMLPFAMDLTAIEQDFNNRDPETLTPQIRREFLNRIKVAMEDAKSRWAMSAPGRSFVSALPAEFLDRLHNLRKHVLCDTPHPQSNPAEQARQQLNRSRSHRPVEGAAVAAFGIQTASAAHPNLQAFPQQTGEGSSSSQQPQLPTARRNRSLAKRMLDAFRSQSKSSRSNQGYGQGRGAGM